jgi:hypothetical protein
MKYTYYTADILLYGLEDWVSTETYIILNILLGHSLW